jgi:hypothetical protein
MGVSATSDGGAIITGTFNDANATFGATTLVQAGGWSTGFAAKVTAAGAWSWAVATGTPTTGNVNPTGVSVTADGGAIITGYFQTANVTFGATTLTKAGGTNTGFAAKVSSAGAWQTAAQPGFPASLTVTVTDASGSASTPVTLTRG